MPNSAISPIAPDALPARIADWLTRAGGTVRIAVDGPPCASADGFAAGLESPLRARGRPFAHVRAEHFWRDASLRFEHGREDVDAYLSWLDHEALRREVLTGDSYLPSLRDPVSNRATREPARPLRANAILVVSGPFLLGLGLPFDRTIHLAMSSAARARRTPADQAWTLQAFDRYDAEVMPAQLADIVVRLDDPRHPALAGLPEHR